MVVASTLGPRCGKRILASDEFAPDAAAVRRRPRGQRGAVWCARMNGHMGPCLGAATIARYPECAHGWVGPGCVQCAQAERSHQGGQH